VPDDTLAIEKLSTTCCIAGGGPAGVVLGYLLARAGVDVVVLEKHKDFFRDFRGDTVHPSTLEVVRELGLLESFLQLPHQEFQHLEAQFGNFTVHAADFSLLPTYCKFLAIVPQWDFLNFISSEGRRYPTFRLLMEHEVTGLHEESDEIRGVTGRTPHGGFEVRALLTVGGDGRHSVVRERAKLKVIDLGSPIDVLWMGFPRKPEDPQSALGRIADRRFMVTIDRRDYWQCAFVIIKGGFDEIKKRGLSAFREDLVEVAPFLRDRVEELKDWEQIKLLSVAVDHLEKWHRPGLLCIGDAAHAMSPVGGVGINLAVQDAVAAANILARPLLARRVLATDLERVQRRREFPAKVTQRLQIFAHEHVVFPILEGRIKTDRLPLFPRLLNRHLWLRRLVARGIGTGVRPEHVHTLSEAPERS
jgi:2-polyprenyl-6-methoxyphenol hydroxylase-like FAD-dependent oxidoreductase